MYGTQDASRIWQKSWAEFFETNGVSSVMTSRCNPALFKSDFVIDFCHGDDFVIAACIDEGRTFGEMVKDPNSPPAAMQKRLHELPAVLILASSS
eukprot:1398143-Amphidinium_carterae.3